MTTSPRWYKSFYEENPFPNYEDHDSVRTLIEKARKGVYARALDRAIPTIRRSLRWDVVPGQLSNFLWNLLPARVGRRPR